MVGKYIAIWFYANSGGGTIVQNDYVDFTKIQLEYELNYIKDPEIRDIIRYKYNDFKSWVQIMFLMKYNSESVAKMKLKRFLEKNKLCDKCDDLN